MDDDFDILIEGQEEKREFSLVDENNHFNTDKLLVLLKRMFDEKKNNMLYPPDMIARRDLDATNEHGKNMFEVICENCDASTLTSFIISHMYFCSDNTDNEIQFNRFMDLIFFGNDELTKMLFDSFYCDITNMDKNHLEGKYLEFYEEFFFGNDVVDHSVLCGHKLPSFITPLFIASRRLDRDLMKKLIDDKKLLTPKDCKYINYYFAECDKEDLDFLKFIAACEKYDFKSDAAHILMQNMFRRGFADSIEYLISEGHSHLIEYNRSQGGYSYAQLAIHGHANDHERVWNIYINQNLNFIDDLKHYSYDIKTPFFKTRLEQLINIGIEIDGKKMLGVLLHNFTLLNKEYLHDIVVKSIDMYPDYVVPEKKSFDIIQNVLGLDDTNIIELLISRQMYELKTHDIEQLCGSVPSENNIFFVLDNADPKKISDAFIDELIFNYIKKPLILLKILKVLFEKERIDINYRIGASKTKGLLHIALIDHKEYIEYLIDNGIDVQIRSTDHLYYYESGNSCNMAKGALFWHRTIGCMNDTEENIQKIAWLKSYTNIDFYETNDAGYNMLHIAVCFNKINLVKYLINEENMDINSLTKLGEDILTLAINKLTSIEMIDYIMDILKLVPSETPCCDTSTETWISRSTNNKIVIMRHLIRRNIPHLDKYFAHDEKDLVLYNIILNE